MNRPPKIDVEAAFGTFVKSIGGEVVSDLLPKSPSFSNADFLFRDQCVVAELKCLTKNILDADDFQEKLNRAIDKWTRDGLITNPGFGQFVLHTAALPPQCQQELFNLIKVPLQTAIKKANEQIKATREHFGLKTAKGLLLIANDGCYSIESDAIMHLIHRVLGDKHSGINTVVYFTVNLPARLPGILHDVLVWVPARRKLFEPVAPAFLHELAQGWISFHEAILGQPTPRIDLADERQLEKVRFIRPSAATATLLPGGFYTDALGRQFACIEVFGDAFTIVRFDYRMEHELADVVYQQKSANSRFYEPIVDSDVISRLLPRFKHVLARYRK